MNSVNDIGSVNTSFTTNGIVEDEADDGNGVFAGGETISSVQFEIVLLPAIALLPIAHGVHVAEDAAPGRKLARRAVSAFRSRN